MGSLPRIVGWFGVLGALGVFAVAGGLVVWQIADADGARSWRQATIIASEVGDIPIARTLAGWVTHEPQAVRTTVVAGLPATMIRPGDTDRHPAVVVMIPQGTSAREQAAITTAQHALARAGIVAWTISVPGTENSLGSAEELVVLREAIQAIGGDGSTRPGHLAIVATGALASQALVSAADPAIDGHVQALLLVLPVADIQGLVRLAITGFTRDARGIDTRHPAGAELRDAAVRELVRSALNRAGSTVPEILRPILQQAVDAQDPLAAIRAIPAESLAGDLGALRAVLTATSPAQFDAFWGTLPAGLRRAADEISPTAIAQQVDARVLLAGPLDDVAYPVDDALRIDALLKDSRVTVSAWLNASGSASPSSGTVLETLDNLAWWLERAGA